MTDDIVARLRNEEHWTIGLCDKAADEIERLRQKAVPDTVLWLSYCEKKMALEDAREEIETLRAEIARKDAAIAGALDHLDPRPGTYSHTAVIILTAALAPAQEASDDAAP
jgi:hypothetical protein